MLYALILLGIFSVAAKAFRVQSALLALVLRTFARMGTIPSQETFATATSSRATWRIVSIRWRELVSVDAMRSASVLGERIITAQCVYSWSNSLKVDRIYTRGASAQVVRLKIAFEYFHKYLVARAGRAHGSLALTFIRLCYVKLAIAILVLARNPKPAGNTFERYVRVYLNLAEKAGKKFAIYRKSISIGFKHRCLLNGNGVGLA